ncbi:MAG TPA: ROK family transcriptional regulator [Vicinamibacteria bacterium]
MSPTAFRIARRGTSREINRQIALNLVRAKQPLSRADLARLMGVRRGAISLLVNELLESGLVFEGQKGESKRGRKPMHLYIETRRHFALAVDVNASRTLIMATDPLGHFLLEVSEFPTSREPQALVKDLAKKIRTLQAQHRALGTCAGVGVVVSGMVDLGGRLRYSPTLGWRDVDLSRPLQAATGLPVVVENSVKACVLGQVWAVRGDPPVDGPVAFVHVSDGVGVGVAIDGKLLRGAHNNAGEYGHMPLDVNGPRCSCGQTGCWESFVSKRATTARYLGADASWPSSGDLEEPTVEEIGARARAGESRARETLRETGDYLGRGLALLVKSLDPSRVYVEGEITTAWDLVLPAVRAALREQALIGDAAELEICPVSFGEYPRLRGAAALVNSPAFAAPIVA